jgi:hypothetical protein
MAQEYSDVALDVMLDSLDALTLYVSAHEASPALIGSNEVSGGAPAYIRKIAAYDAAVDGVMALTSAPLTLDIPASTTVTYLGLWDAESNGNFIGQVLIADEVFGSQGTLDITALPLDLLEFPA